MSIKPRLRWSEESRVYVKGHDLLLGERRVASVFPWSDPDYSEGSWRASIPLPGVQTRRTIFPTQQEAMELAERGVRFWFSKTGFELPQ